MLRLMLTAVIGTTLAATSSAQFFAPFPFGPSPFGPPVRLGVGPVVATPLGPAFIGPPRYRARRFGYPAVVAAPPVVAIPPATVPGHYRDSIRVDSPSYSTRVDVDGYGGVRVDAPGFRMNLPGWGGPAIAYGAPSVDVEPRVLPNLAPMTGQVPSVQTRIQIRDAVDRLDRALALHPEGDVWRNYLQPQRVATALDQLELAASPADQAALQDELASLAMPFQGVASNPQLSWLASMDGFQTVLSGLSAFNTAAVASDNPSAAMSPSMPTLAPSYESARPSGDDATADGGPNPASDEAPSVLQDSASDADPVDAAASSSEELPAPAPQPDANPNRQSI